jgi:hypothetical protein
MICLITDGLRFSVKQEYLFVTTDNILKNYLAGRPELPKDLAELSRTGEFYVSPLRRMRLLRTLQRSRSRVRTGKSYVRAFLGLTAQDTGPFIPKEIFVFVTNGNRILAVCSRAATQIREILQCRNKWERFAKKRSDAYEVYRSSGLNNQRRSMNQFNMSSKDSRAYQRCYDREAKNQQFRFP